MIFVDACLKSDSLENRLLNSSENNFENLNVQVRRIEPDNNKIIAGHTANPESLLVLTQALYNHYPPGW